MLDRSEASLLARRIIASDATHGDWEGFFDDGNHLDGVITCGHKNIALCGYNNVPEVTRRVTREEQRANTIHIAVNGPKAVIEDIDEILSLRKRLEQKEKELDLFAWLMSEIDMQTSTRYGRVSLARSKKEWRQIIAERAAQKSASKPRKSKKQ